MRSVYTISNLKQLKLRVRIYTILIKEPVLFLIWLGIAIGNVASCLADGEVTPTGIVIATPLAILICGLLRLGCRASNEV